MADTANWQQNGKLTNGGSGGKDGIGLDLDAEMEEQAGYKIQKSWYTTMDKDDFLLGEEAVVTLPSFPSKNKKSTDVKAITT